MLVEHCASLFQPQYVDGLLNPSHRTLSFTTIWFLELLVPDWEHVVHCYPEYQRWETYNPGLLLTFLTYSLEHVGNMLSPTINFPCSCYFVDYFQHV